jgi:hypothetical protein
LKIATCARPGFRAGFFVAPATVAWMPYRQNQKRITLMTIPSRGPGGKPVTRALIAALEPAKVVLAWKSDPWCIRRT